MNWTCPKRDFHAIVTVLLLIAVVAAAGGCKKKGDEGLEAPGSTQTVEQAQTPPQQEASSTAENEEQAVGQEAVAVEHDRSLRVLYAGRPNSGRGKDFVKFLAQHFDTVETGDLRKFTDPDAEGFDVTILDYDGDGFKAPRPSISRDFSRPVMTLGVPGARICDSLDLKTGYL